MIQAINTATTALKAFSKVLDVSANNIANIDTDGFKKSQVVMSEIKSGGVQSKTEIVNTSGVMVPDRITGEMIEASNVDMLEEITNQLSARYAYEANMLTIKTANEMFKTLISIV
jgi:flagellar basal body rod protein FlgG